MYVCMSSSALRVGFFNIGLGRVGYWTKYRVAGRVGVSKYTIGYFRVSFLLSGISGYVGYFRVFPGIYGYLRVFTGIYGMGKYIFNGGEGRTNEKRHQRCM